MPETDERYTSPGLCALVRAAFRGEIDTDPCWHPKSFVRARRTYTKRDDGLVLPWYGRTILNPPWSNVGPWAQRAEALLRQRPLFPDEQPFEVQAIVRLDTAPAWCRVLHRCMSAVAMSPERTRYWKTNDAGDVVPCGGPTFCTAVWYGGPHVRHFCDVYRAEGWVVAILPSYPIGSTLPLMPTPESTGPDLISFAARAYVARVVQANPTRPFHELLAEMRNAFDAALDVNRWSLADLAEHFASPASASELDLGRAPAVAPPLPAPAPQTADEMPKPKRRRKPQRRRHDDTPPSDSSKRLSVVPSPDTSSKGSKRGRGRPKGPSKKSREREQAILDYLAARGDAGASDTFTASEICDELGWSRQTVLRTLGRMNVTKSGGTRTACYQLQSA
jgi:hypothetical protein